MQERLAPLHEAILAGRNPGIFSADLPLTIRRRGEEWEEARFTVAYSPIPDFTAPTGVGGVLITAVETTERVRIENKLRESEERFEFALDAAQELAPGIGIFETVLSLLTPALLVFILWIRSGPRRASQLKSSRRVFIPKIATALRSQ